MNEKFEQFTIICKALNEQGITPLLMGSVGLEVLTERSWQARDLDIHVPGDARGWEVPAEKSIDEWSEIMKRMEGLGYRLVDLHEHQFLKDGEEVEFGIIDTLPAFAGIPIEQLKLQERAGACFYLPTAEQYLRIYEASSKDSYRSTKNNDKDQEKITYLLELQQNNPENN
ncbi:phosphoribosylanthranilate isomerase [Geomicrobium sp. JSM 1781026]|uniref:phosphoribosylanthranilate isomerase n=1 Tax=Geomicrobium sp. JSM 1781026 TaxID=3344580 RepID=UPI0035BF966D